MSETLQTAGPAAALRLTPETDQLGTGFDDVAMVRLTVIDARGIPVPDAAVPVRFSVSGPGVLLATDNAEDTYSAPFSSPQRTTYEGRAVVLLRGTGRGSVHVRAESAGLRAGELDLQAGSARAYENGKH